MGSLCTSPRELQHVKDAVEEGHHKADNCEGDEQVNGAGDQGDH